MTDAQKKKTIEAREESRMNTIDRISGNISNLIQKCHDQIMLDDEEKFHPGSWDEQVDRMKMAMALSDSFIKINGGPSKLVRTAFKKDEPVPEAEPEDVPQESTTSRPMIKSFGPGDVGPAQ